jgi:hypothetical protein
VSAQNNVGGFQSKSESLRNTLNKYHTFYPPLSLSTPCWSTSSHPNDGGKRAGGRSARGRLIPSQRRKRARSRSVRESSAATGSRSGKTVTMLVWMKENKTRYDQHQPSLDSLSNWDDFEQLEPIHSNADLPNQSNLERFGATRTEMHDAAPDSWPDGKKGTPIEIIRSNGQPGTIGCSSRRTRSGDDSLDGVMRRNKAFSMASQGTHIQFKRRTRQLGPSRDDSW